MPRMEMEYFLPYLISAPYTTMFAFVVFVLSLLWIMSKKFQKNKANKKGVPPEAAGAWPLIGHLPLLGGAQPAHITLGNMVDKYGSLFTIKLGVHRALVVCSWDMAKECLNTNDRVFATRPKMVMGKLMGYDYAMFGTSPYGPYWREVRKLATMHLLSNHQLELLTNIRESEVQACTKHIYDLWEKNKAAGNYSNEVLVEMRRWFGDVTMNVMFRVVVGKRFHEAETTVHQKEENERCQMALRDFLKLAGEFVVSDNVPSLKWLDLGGFEKAMRKTAKDLDTALQGCLEEHKQKRSDSSYGKVKDERDFMDMMLSVFDDPTKEFPRSNSTNSDTINKATCLTAMLGGTDPTTATLTWTLSLLMNNREALRKAQQELDIQVGRERKVKESDLKNLVYLQAIVKEVLRLYPPTPLAIPHECMEDCTVGNYHVCAGTRLLVNISKIHRDPNVWPDPCQFQPERFLGADHKDFDVRGQNFVFIPFGSGRRMCPGVSLALQVVQLTMAHLLHGFEITTPDDAPIDMTESSGITNMKATPLEVLLTPRLPAKLYENIVD